MDSSWGTCHTSCHCVRLRQRRPGAGNSRWAGEQLRLAARPAVAPQPPAEECGGQALTWAELRGKTGELPGCRGWQDAQEDPDSPPARRVPTSPQPRTALSGLQGRQQKDSTGRPRPWLPRADGWAPCPPLEPHGERERNDPALIASHTLINAMFSPHGTLLSSAPLARKVNVLSPPPKLAAPQ